MAMDSESHNNSNRPPAARTIAENENAIGSWLNTLGAERDVKSERSDRSGSSTSFQTTTSFLPSPVHSHADE
jgi:hypothetical protein